MDDTWHGIYYSLLRYTCYRAIPKRHDSTFPHYKKLISVHAKSMVMIHDLWYTKNNAGRCWGGLQDVLLHLQLGNPAHKSIQIPMLMRG